MKLIIYEPGKLYIPGITKETNYFKRAIYIQHLYRKNDTYRVGLNHDQFERFSTFISENPRQEYFFYFEELNKWISSKIFYPEGNELVLYIFSENFIVNSKVYKEY